MSDPVPGVSPSALGPAKTDLVVTADGSHTLVSGAGILYHTHHGAIQESRHIFIEVGLKETSRVFPEAELSILEVGFGTGLYAFLAALEAEALRRPSSAQPSNCIQFQKHWRPRRRGERAALQGSRRDERGAALEHDDEPGQPYAKAGND